jgi:hypothetical protein
MHFDPPINHFIVYFEVMNHSDNQNKFDIEINDSFPFILLNQNENWFEKEDIVKSEKNEIPD